MARKRKGGKVAKVLGGEYKRGELHSGSKKGPKVTNPRQAKAIALSEARRAGEKVQKAPGQTASKREKRLEGKTL